MGLHPCGTLPQWLEYGIITRRSPVRLMVVLSACMILSFMMARCGAVSDGLPPTSLASFHMHPFMYTTRAICISSPSPSHCTHILAVHAIRSVRIALSESSCIPRAVVCLVAITGTSPLPCLGGGRRRGCLTVDSATIAQSVAAVDIARMLVRSGYTKRMDGSL